MIAAYPNRPSVRCGETLKLHLSTDRPCRLRFVRAGRTNEIMTEYRDLPIRRAVSPPGNPGEPWNWPWHSFEIPERWRSGVYIALLEEVPSVPCRLDAREGRCVFIVRPQSPQAPILYNVPVFTYHAYNVGVDAEAEATCLYNNARSVTLSRPGGGSGGHLWDEQIVDVYDPETPRQTFAHWDRLAIRWLESHFPDVDYACDLDLHEDAGTLSGYQLLLGFGHHEYWSDAMRDALRSHLRSGKNAAFFSGNTCWFRIAYNEERMSISRLGRWTEDPEECTFGVSYRYGGGKWRAGRPPTGYIVGASHWIYDDCGVRRGEVFGDDDRLIGYECDGTPDQPLPSFELLAHGSVTNWSVADGSGEINAGRASLGILRDTGLLFTAGTVDWARVLASSEPVVDRITDNVVRRLSSS